MVSCINAYSVTSDWFAVCSGVRQSCWIAPDLFLNPMDYLLEHTVHRGIPGVCLENEIFRFGFCGQCCSTGRNVGSAILALTVMQEEVASFGLQINWSRTKILQSGNSLSSTCCPGGRWTSRSGRLTCLSGKQDRLFWCQQRPGPAEDRHWLDLHEPAGKRIWKSSIRLDTKMQLYKTYIVPVLMSGCETWVTTRYLCVCPVRCIWYMGSPQDPDDPLHSS